MKIGWNHDKYIVPDIVGMQYQGFFYVVQRIGDTSYRNYFYIAKGNEENGRF